MSDDVPLRLREAALRFGIGIDTLKAEAARGRLAIFPIGNKLYTTAADVKRMVELCREDAALRAYISTRREANGLSETERVSSAQAALQLHLAKRRNSLPSTSAANINRKRAAIR